MVDTLSSSVPKVQPTGDLVRDTQAQLAAMQAEHEAATALRPGERDYQMVKGERLEVRQPRILSNGHVAATVSRRDADGLLMGGFVDVVWDGAAAQRHGRETLNVDSAIMADVGANLRHALGVDSKGVRGEAPRRFKPLAEFLAEEDEAQEWVCDGLLPLGGVSLLIGKPKTGKSVLADNLALAVARGARFLGRQTLHGPVLVLSLEESETQVRKRYRRMGAASEPIHLYVASAPRDAVTWLTEQVIEHQPALVVIDPLQRFARFRDVNDYGQVYNGLEPIVSLARENRSHILLCHHAGKAEGGFAGDNTLGSTALFGSVDTLLSYQRDADGQRILLSIQRYGDDMPPTLIALDSETTLVRSGGAVTAAKQRDIEQKMLDALANGALSEKALRVAVSGGAATVSGALQRLVAEGLVKRLGDGKRGSPFLYSAISR